MNFKNPFARAPVAPPKQAGLAQEPREKKRAWFSRSLAQMFKAAQVDANDKWSGTPLSPDQYITQKLPILVARSREQWSNNDYMRSFVRIACQNIVGPNGVTMQSKAEKPRGGLDIEACAAIEADWRDWCLKQNCDVTGKKSWRALQKLAVATAARDGEFLFRKIYGENAGAHGFALQVLDPQRLAIWYDNIRHGKDGSFIKHGIEFNAYGKPIAFHFSSTDEGDAYFYMMNGRGFVRVAAEEIIHGFEPDMVGQKRGIPWASSSLFRLHHLAGAEDASVQNARAGASKLGFIEYDEGFGPDVDDDCDVAGTIDMTPLSIHELPQGAHFKEFAPQYPSGEFAPFAKHTLRGAAAGMGVLYNTLASDLEGVNFSSIRQGTLDEREHWKEKQVWLIEELCAPVFDAWLRYRLLTGGLKTKSGRPLPPERYAAYAVVVWQARRWQWIDPRADVESALDSIKGGLTSFSQVIRDQGRDPDEVFKEWAADIAKMKAAGIPQNIIELMMGKKEFPPPQPKSDPAKAE